jgi:TetR/AcrR family transcriptional regulator of autoinduction and epiphytic fitness
MGEPLKADDAADVAGGEGETDGRRARAERNRDAVVDAILEILREGNPQPGAAEIAERAGVSLRSVFRHFDDLDTLHAVAVERHSALIAPLFEITLPAAPAGGSWAPLGDRIESFVRQRAVLLEEMRPVRSVAERLRHRSRPIAEGLDRGRRLLRDQLRRVFEPELDALDTNDRRDLFDALEAVTSFGVWQHLRTDQGLSKARAAAAIERSVRALLES